MAVRRRPSTARMTGAWNTLPARPNPTSPTVSMTGDCTGKAEVRYGRAGARSLSRCKIAEQVQATFIGRLGPHPLAGGEDHRGTKRAPRGEDQGGKKRARG